MKAQKLSRGRSSEPGHWQGDAFMPSMAGKATEELEQKGEGVRSTYYRDH